MVALEGAETWAVVGSPGGVDDDYDVGRSPCHRCHSSDSLAEAEGAAVDCKNYHNIRRCSIRFHMNQNYKDIGYLYNLWLIVGSRERVGIS